MHNENLGIQNEALKVPRSEHSCLMGDRTPSTESATQRMLEALETGDVEVLRARLLSGDDVNECVQHSTSRSALHLASALTSPECLIELLRREVKPQWTLDGRNETAMHIAARCSRSVTSVMLLLSIYGISNRTNLEKETFFHVLMRNQLIGRTQLHEVVSWLVRHPEFCELLNYVNANGETAYDIASHYQAENAPLLRLLLEYGALKSNAIYTNLVVHFTTVEESKRAFLQQMEHEHRCVVGSAALRSSRRIRKWARRVARLQEAQLIQRRQVEEIEEASRRVVPEIERKERREAEVTADVRRGNAAAFIISRTGRGFLARTDMGSRYRVQCCRKKAAETLQRFSHGMRERSVLHNLLQSRAMCLKAEEEELATDCGALASPLWCAKHMVDAALCAVCEGAANRDGQYCTAAGDSFMPMITHLFTNLDDTVTVGVAPHQYVFGVPQIRSAYSNGARGKEELQLSGEVCSSPERMLYTLVTRIQAQIRTFLCYRRYRSIQQGTVCVQRAWRMRRHRQKCRKGAAVDILTDALTTRLTRLQLQRFAVNRFREFNRERIDSITSAVTRLVWRENFCSAFREIVFRRKRERLSEPPRISTWRRCVLMTERYSPYTLLVQFSLSCASLIYMGSIPRNAHTRAHNAVDIMMIVLQLVVACCLPPRLWRLLDGLIIVVALVCAACAAYDGAIVITLFTLKLPFVVRAFATGHSGTRTYCRAIEQSILYLLSFLPLGVAGVGAAVTGTTLNRYAREAKGNWADMFLSMWSTVAPQYRVYALQQHGIPVPDYRDSPVAVARATVRRYDLPDVGVFISAQMPLAQLVVFYLFLYLYTWAAVVVGTHSALRKHYDISDETKLKKDRHRFRNLSKLELAEAHRAVSMEALGKQLDGVMWEADVHAAKEAIDASHYDHNAGHTVHRFVRRVQESVARGNVSLEPTVRLRRKYVKPVVAEWGKWDCRNEDPRSRGTYDIEVIETALGMVERWGAAERFFRRQWEGNVYRRETTVILIAVLIASAIKPNLFVMEACFSAFFTLELLCSFYYLGLSFILSHYLCTAVRLLCALVGFIPVAIPFAAFRGLRLLEGWPTIFFVPGMVRWGLLYGAVTLVTLWMVAFVASRQYLFAASPNASLICEDTLNCLAISLREMVLPAWTVTHVDVSSEAPVMVMVILVFQMIYVPFILTIGLHPLLHLSNFIGRFLRLVVQSLHKDMLAYLNNYVEGASWYSHWSLKAPMPPSMVTKLKLWVRASQRRRTDEAICNIFTPINEPSVRYSQDTLVAPREVHFYCVAFPDPEIICRGEFASLEENECNDRAHQSEWAPLAKVKHALRHPALHYTNAVLSFVSIVFLWVVDSTYPHHDARIVVSTVVHILSIAVSLLVIPRDISAIFTVASLGSLFAAVILKHWPGGGYDPWYSLRFISLFRLGQLQVWEFRRIRRYMKTYVDASLRIFFPIIFVSFLALLIILLVTQFYLVLRYNPTEARSGNVGGAPKENTVSTNVSFPDTVASRRRTNPAYPNTDDVRALFAYYIQVEAYVLFPILNVWLFPACCISSCLAHLLWSGANLLDTHRLLINMIPLMEDPVTVAAYPLHRFYYSLVGDAFLVMSLVCGCIFRTSSPAMQTEGRLFFGLELTFTIVGLLDAIVRMIYAVHRCGSAWTSWNLTRGDSTTAQVPIKDTLFLALEVVQCVYYSLCVPLSATLLQESVYCLLDADQYTTYFVTSRFVLLLRMLPREFSLAVMQGIRLLALGSVGILLFFFASASALADICASKEGQRTTIQLWSEALNDFIRQAITVATPREMGLTWKPLNAAAIADDMIQNNRTVQYISTDYHSFVLQFVLSIVGRIMLASITGLAMSLMLVPLRTVLLHPLPPKSTLLYRSLCGGVRNIVAKGIANHDDMRPEDREKVQRRKFARIFNSKGIPRWALPHLLEELDICRPGRQRRFMFILRCLLEYLPVSEKRQYCVQQYMEQWYTYRCGGPAKLNFSSLPVFPENDHHTTPNPYAPATVAAVKEEGYIQPLRLVQALALFELDFPSDSSVGSKLWCDFFIVVQKLRGATLMQSLWRMYRAVKTIDADPHRSRQERMMIVSLRHSFRKACIRCHSTFLCNPSFRDALRMEQGVFNPGTGHFDLLNRLRGHYNDLEPTESTRYRSRQSAKVGGCEYRTTLTSTFWDPERTSVHRYVGGSLTFLAKVPPCSLHPEP